MSGPSIAILTEGSQELGFGHLTRCCALYEAFGDRDARASLFVDGDESARAMLRGVSSRLCDWRCDSAVLDGVLRGTDVAVVDSYLAGFDVLNRIQQRVSHAVYLDDTNRLTYPAGTVLNGAVFAPSMAYRGMAGRTLLLGGKYCLLRKPFWDAHASKPRSDADPAVFVSLGGGSHSQQYRDVLSVLKATVNPRAVRVLSGQPADESLVDLLGALNVQWLQRASAETVVRCMVESDFAVSAAGQTLLELCAVGVPTVAVPVAENQAPHARYVAQHGLALAVFRPDDDSFRERLAAALREMSKRETRTTLRNRCGQQIDNRGALRAVDAILDDDGESAPRKPER